MCDALLTGLAIDSGVAVVRCVCRTSQRASRLPRLSRPAQAMECGSLLPLLIRQIAAPLRVTSLSFGLHSGGKPPHSTVQTAMVYRSGLCGVRELAPALAAAACRITVHATGAFPPLEGGVRGGGQRSSNHLVDERPGVVSDQATTSSMNYSEATPGEASDFIPTLLTAITE